jgi:hypothetical protein
MLSASDEELDDRCALDELREAAPAPEPQAINKVVAPTVTTHARLFTDVPPRPDQPRRRLYIREIGRAMADIEVS